MAMLVNLCGKSTHPAKFAYDANDLLFRGNTFSLTNKDASASAFYLQWDQTSSARNISIDSTNTYNNIADIINGPQRGAVRVAGH